MEEIEIYKMDHQGRGIGKINNLIVFVPNTLAGELVKIKVVKVKKKYLEGKVEEIILPSKDRVKSPCLYYDECGGCNLLHLGYQNQLKYKEELVKDVFDRYCNQKDIVINNIVSDEQFYYRNKVTFHVKNKMGFYKNKTNSIIPIKKCLLLNEKINYILESIEKNLDLKDITKIIIRCGFQEIMVIFETKKQLNLKFLEDKVNSIYLKNIQYNKIYGSDQIIEKINDYSFLISPDAFFQVNTKVATKLYDKIIELGQFKKNETVLDLYCGTGTIGIYLSKYVKSVIGIELNNNAIKDALLNRKINNINNIDFVNGDVGEILSCKKLNADAVVVDPPRSGLSKNALNHIRRISSDKIIYVSCDVNTLVRDLNLLNDLYEIISVTPFDMFPNTRHVECVCLLKLK